MPVKHVIELAVFCVLAGAAAGYAMRELIASEISKFSLAKIVASLENLAKEDSDKIREEVSSVAAYLRKHL